jgi:hypothetical protein
MSGAEWLLRRDATSPGARAGVKAQGASLRAPRHNLEARLFAARGCEDARLQSMVFAVLADLKRPWEPSRARWTRRERPASRCVVPEGDGASSA